jgi:hypothetical protein
MCQFAHARRKGRDPKEHVGDQTKAQIALWDRNTSNLERPRSCPYAIPDHIDLQAFSALNRSQFIQQSNKRPHVRVISDRRISGDAPGPIDR